MKLGANFGTTPFGLHQVAAFRERCSCDPRFDIPYIDCPQHGLVQHFRRLREARRAA